MHQQQCQVLANLCVLQLYKFPAMQCERFREAGKPLGKLVNTFYHNDGYRMRVVDGVYKGGLPWLYYQSGLGGSAVPTAGKKVLTEENRVKFRASFDLNKPAAAIVSQLNFTLSKYNIYGEFLGFEPLTDQIIICETLRDDVAKLMQVGVTLLRECSFDLARLKDPAQYPKQTNFFYEMWLSDYNGDLIDVPVKINNLWS